MNSRAAILEIEVAGCCLAVRLFVCEFRILDHLKVIVADGNHAHALLCIALGAQLKGEVGLLGDVQANESRISDLHHGIVNLEEEYGGDAALLHVGQTTVLFKGRDGSAVTVRTHEDMAGLVKNDFPVCG